MKLQKLYAFLLALIPFISAAAQDRQSDGPTAADFFYRAPLSVASGLSEISRLDMVDYFNHGSSVRNENRLGTKVGLKALCDNLIAWQDDDSVMTAVAVLPASKGDTLLMVIRTVQTPMADSEILAYDSRWQPLAVKKVIPQPQLKDWLTTNDRAMLREVQDALPFMLVTAEYDADAHVLTLINRTADYFVPSDRPAALDHLKKELRYQWNGSTFKPLGK